MTVIIVPHSRPTTKSHEFKGTTVSGREISIEVTAAVDVSEAGVLADLRKSMPGVSDLAAVDVSEKEFGYFGIAGVLLFFWVIVLVFGVVVMLVLGAADFVRLPTTYWDTWIPIAGGHSVGIGLFRIWVVLIPVIVVPIAMYFRHVEKKEMSALKVGR